jgi:hypothetical protein
VVGALPVDSQELAALFCGVEHEDGGWETTPVQTANLLVAICRQVRPGSEDELRKWLYGERSTDDLERRTLMLITVAYQRYRSARPAAIV